MWTASGSRWTAPSAAGSVGPGHLKITDHSWDKVQDFLPLLPVISVLGATPKVEVVGVK